MRFYFNNHSDIRIRWAICKKDDRTLKEAETGKWNLETNMTYELTDLDFYFHLTKNDNGTISPASHFLNFPCQPAFGIFAKPHNPTHNSSFAKESNFARFPLNWRFFDFQIKPEIYIFGKNWVRYA